MGEGTARRARDGWQKRAGDTLLGLGERLRRRPSAKAERLLFGASLIVFAVAAAAAAWNFPTAVQDVRWGLLIAVGLIGTPANLVFNAVEFRIIGRFVGHRVSMVTATKVTIVGSAANLLPVPGSTLVRVQALASEQVRYRDAAAASVAVGVLSVGANLTLAGAAQLPRASLGVTAALIGAGVAVIAVALLVTASVASTEDAAQLSWFAVGLELLYAMASAVRLWLILVALGLDVALASALALTAAGSLATAVGFFPAGLGVRELLVGAVSPLVGVSVAAGLAGAVAQRLFSFVVLAVASGAVMVRTRGEHQRFPQV